MKRILLILFVFSACKQQQKDLSKKSAGEIISADKAMSEAAAKDGFYKTLLLYADDSIVKPDEGALPVIGKTELEKKYGTLPETKSITWWPFKAEAAKSGDIGYTLGYWKYASKDTTMYGNYYTIWKKQPDGKWKLVVDGGNNTPKPPDNL